MPSIGYCLRRRPIICTRSHLWKRPLGGTSHKERDKLTEDTMGVTPMSAPRGSWRRNTDHCRGYAQLVGKSASLGYVQSPRVCPAWSLDLRFVSCGYTSSLRLERSNRARFPLPSQQTPRIASSPCCVESMWKETGAVSDPNKFDPRNGDKSNNLIISQ